MVVYACRRARVGASRSFHCWAKLPCSGSLFCPAPRSRPFTFLCNASTTVMAVFVQFKKRRSFKTQATTITLWPPNTHRTAPPSLQCTMQLQHLMQNPDTQTTDEVSTRWPPLHIVISTVNHVLNTGRVHCTQRTGTQ